MKKFVACFVVLSIALAYSSNINAQENKKGDFLTRAIDKSVKPGDDFFKYATGTWMKENPIPPAERTWGIWNLVQEETYDRIKKIIAEAENSNAPEGSNEQKIGDFYAQAPLR